MICNILRYDDIDCYIFFNYGVSVTNDLSHINNILLNTFQKRRSQVVMFSYHINRSTKEFFKFHWKFHKRL